MSSSYITTKPIASGFQLLVDDVTFEEPTEIREEVNEIWDAAVRINPKLFDGDTLCVTELRANSVLCRIVPYRFVFAQAANAIVGSRLDLTIVAVSGITFAQNHVLWGVRNEYVTQFPKYRELVPSGSISARNTFPDFKGQLLTELFEETLIDSNDVTEILPFLLVTDRKSGVIDVCCKIHLNRERSASEIVENFIPGEYSELHAAPILTLKHLAMKESDLWVPTSVAILNSL